MAQGLIFTAQGNGKDGPPDKTPIDNALAVWHSDKTENMNPGRPAQDGDFCLGVWEAEGGASTSSATLPEGQRHHQRTRRDWEAAGRDSYCGKGDVECRRQELLGDIHAGRLRHFINCTAHIVGVIKGTRVTTSTTIGELMSGELFAGSGRRGVGNPPLSLCRGAQGAGEWTCNTIKE
jgi:hypothetical protein